MRSANHFVSVTSSEPAEGRRRFAVTLQCESGGDATFIVNTAELLDYKRFQVAALERAGVIFCDVHVGKSRRRRVGDWPIIVQQAISDGGAVQQ